MEIIKLLDYFCCFQLVKSHSHTIKLLDYFASVSDVVKPFPLCIFPLHFCSVSLLLLKFELKAL